MAAAWLQALSWHGFQQKAKLCIIPGCCTAAATPMPGAAM
jgi:hypothetical protein